MTATNSDTTLSWIASPVPAARAMDNFSATAVGNGEYVFLDNERLEYHTMNESAFAVWQLCDGVRTSSQIAAALAVNGSGMPVEAVELAIAELGEAGLLESTSNAWGAPLTRRRVVKLAAAGTFGSVLLPGVASISAPVSANHTTCPAGGQIAGGHCENPTCSCATGLSCCCQTKDPTNPIMVCGAQAGGSDQCSNGPFVWVC